MASVILFLPPALPPGSTALPRPEHEADVIGGAHVGVEAAAFKGFHTVPEMPHFPFW